MASPHVAGAAELFVVNSLAGGTAPSPDAVKQGLADVATPQNDYDYGDGRGGFTGDRDAFPERLLDTHNPQAWRKKSLVGQSRDPALVFFLT